MKKNLCRVPRSRILGKVKKYFFPEEEREEKNEQKNLCRVPRSRTLGKVKKYFFLGKKEKKKNEKKSLPSAQI